ncbi:MAG: O-methyltransferase [Roseburia sp.]|nr:O-methyltransferase [Anaeroplasma bactoclasticum]MCM1195846.1 O-methyltransferase [Roseburia sp.]MCM1556317.1 O-methyltransferase [Anaeroplasma bactoclasticum]
MAVEQKTVTVMETVESNPLNLVWTDLDIELKNYAQEHHVPIIVDEGLALLEQIIRIARPKHILEIGTAIGYSATRMARVCGSQITTIERNHEMVEIAKDTIQRSGFEQQICLIECDALEAFELVRDMSFDLIFIDAAKAQYQKFFELYTPLLTSYGIVVSDNMSFHGLVNTDDYEAQSRSVRGLIRKLAKYQEYLLRNSNYDTSIFELGDGVAISVKKV